MISLQFSARLLTACAALLFLAACGKPGGASSRTITLDSDPPGSEVFLGGASLGRTPCVLSEARLHALGLKWPEYIHNGNSLSMSWELDTAGILVRQGESGNFLAEIVLQTEDCQHGPELLITETPWGVMAIASELDRGGVDDDHLSYHIESMPAENANGLVLKMAMPADDIKPAGMCAVTLAGREVTPSTALSCFRPGVEIYCSRFDEPAKEHTVLKTALPDTWRFFKPGEENTAIVAFPVPAEAGDYCVFTVVTLHMDPEGEKIYQALYSNGKLLRVER